MYSNDSQSWSQPTVSNTSTTNSNGPYNGGYVDPTLQRQEQEKGFALSNPQLYNEFGQRRPY